MFFFRTVSLVLIIIIIFCAYIESTRISLENYSNNDGNTIDVSNNQHPNSPPVFYNQGLENTKNSNNLNGNILFDKTINANLNAYSNPQFISNVLNSSLDTIMGNAVIPNNITTFSPLTLSGNANVLSMAPIMQGNNYIPSMISGNIDTGSPMVTMAPIMQGNNYIPSMVSGNISMNNSMGSPMVTMAPMISGNITTY